MTHPVIEAIFSLEQKREDLRDRRDEVYEQMHTLEETADCAVASRYEETKEKSLSNAEKRRRATDKMLEENPAYQKLCEEYHDLSGTIRRMGFAIDREKRRFTFDCADRSGASYGERIEC